MTAAEKRAKKKRRLEYETIFINGKQKRIKRNLIDGIPADEYVSQITDEVWLMQNGEYERLYELEQARNKEYKEIKNRKPNQAASCNPAPQDT